MTLSINDLFACFVIGGAVGGILALFLGKRPQPKVKVRRGSVEDMPADLRGAFEAPIDGDAIVKDLLDRGILVQKKEGTQ